MLNKISVLDKVTERWKHWISCEVYLSFQIHCFVKSLKENLNNIFTALSLSVSLSLSLSLCLSVSLSLSFSVSLSLFLSLSLQKYFLKKRYTKVISRNVESVQIQNFLWSVFLVFRLNTRKCGTKKSPNTAVFHTMLNKK